MKIQDVKDKLGDKIWKLLNSQNQDDLALGYELAKGILSYDERGVLSYYLYFILMPHHLSRELLNQLSIKVVGNNRPDEFREAKRIIKI